MAKSRSALHTIQPFIRMNGWSIDYRTLVRDRIFAIRPAGPR